MELNRNQGCLLFTQGNRLVHLLVKGCAEFLNEFSTFHVPEFLVLVRMEGFRAFSIQLKFRNFRNEGKWCGYLSGKFPENPKIAKFSNN